MTEVQFHFNVPDRLVYACRLLRKALRSGARGDAHQIGSHLVDLRAR